MQRPQLKRHARRTIALASHCSLLTSWQASAGKSSFSSQSVRPASTQGGGAGGEGGWGGGGSGGGEGEGGADDGAWSVWLLIILPASRSDSLLAHTPQEARHARWTAPLISHCAGVTVLHRSGPKPRAPLSKQGCADLRAVPEGEGEGSAKAADEGRAAGGSHTKSLQLPLSSVLNSCAAHQDLAHHACSHMNLQSDARA